MTTRWNLDAPEFVPGQWATPSRLQPETSTSLQSDSSASLQPAPSSLTAASPAFQPRREIPDEGTEEGLMTMVNRTRTIRLTNQDPSSPPHHPNTSSPYITYSPHSPAPLNPPPPKHPVASSKHGATPSEHVTRSAGATHRSEGMATPSTPSLGKVPRYSEVVAENSGQQATTILGAPGSSGALCPYWLEAGTCEEGGRCVNVHGEFCRHCERYCLPPGDKQMQQHHKDICETLRVQYNEAAEASRDLSCTICYEVVLEKEEKKQRQFGLLSECTHTFCLECIRKWRASQSGEANKRKCPICRKLSYFVIPSKVWVSDMAEKDRLIQGYKEHLSTKDCMHFNKGQDFCPFGPNCFYRHALPDGTIVSDNVVKRRVNSEGDAVVLSTPFLSDFLEELLSYSSVPLHLQVHAIRALFNSANQ